MKPTKFDVRFTDELMLSRGGWVLAGQLLGRTRLGERLGQLQLGGPGSGSRKPSPLIGHGEVALSMIGLLCVAKPDFAAIEDEASEELLIESLGLERVPSEATLRQRLDELGSLQLSEVRRIVREESAAMILDVAPKLRPLKGAASGGGLIPLDIDVSPFDNSNTKKEGASYTYKGMDGYAPILAYYGQEGYLLDAELREGSQHSQKGFVEFLRPCLDSAESLRRKFAPQGTTLVRLDSGHDAAETIGSLQLARRRQPLHWLLKANLRGKDRGELLEAAQAHGTASHPREGKTVWIADDWMEREPDSGKVYRVVIEAIERTIDAAGQLLLLPEVEINLWWTSLPPTKFSAQRVIELYHDHATSEQFHSELKTDMNLERLPSGKFNTNALVLSLGVVAYNLLRLLDRRSLDDELQLPPSSRPRMKRDAKGRPRVKRRRLGTIIQDLMYLAVKLVRTGRRTGLRLCRAHRWSHLWHALYARLAAAP